MRLPSSPAALAVVLCVSTIAACGSDDEEPAPDASVAGGAAGATAGAGGGGAGAGAGGAGGAAGATGGSGGTGGSTAGSSGSSGAAAGSAGAAGAAGTAGTSGGSGTAGTAGASGNAGNAGTAGSAGTAGTAGQGGGGAAGSAGATGGAGGATGGAAGAGAAGAAGSAGAATSNIKNVVLLVQENHTFDSYFGTYCTAAPGSSPACTTGPGCCEAVPATDPTGASPIVLDDASNAARDPNHTEACELDQINGGKMDRFVKGSAVSGCSNAKNFAVADAATVGYYRSLAANHALADRYFQPIAGQSSANDMYFATSKFVFADNGVEPNAIGKTCAFNKNVGMYSGTTIADLLLAAKQGFGVYAEGYEAMATAVASGSCPPIPAECGVKLPFYPCLYDPSDIAFAYYPSLVDNPLYMHDLKSFSSDVTAGKLPAFSFVKTIGYKTEHPGYGTKISTGMGATQAIVEAILAGPQANDTLILITWDEGGGYFDHVPPPPTSSIDGKPYGTRVPLLAVGRFARKNAVSHVVMEHSSIVKFLEHNFLGTTGQLGGRDTEVANIGSLLDPTQTGIAVPEN